MDTRLENAARWRAWRSACEAGQGWTEAYDRYLHPATRIDAAELTYELGLDEAPLSVASTARSA